MTHNLAANYKQNFKKKLFVEKNPEEPQKNPVLAGLSEGTKYIMEKRGILTGIHQKKKEQK